MGFPRMRFTIRIQVLDTLARLSMIALLVPGSAFATATDSCVMSATLIPSDSFWIGDASNPDFMISADQKIGIGTSSPSAQVHIKGSAGPPPFQVKNADSHILFNVNTDGSIQIGTQNSTRPFTINASTLTLHQSLTVSSGTTQIDGNLSINTNPTLPNVPTVVLPVGMQVGSPPSTTDSSRLTPTFSVKGTATDSFYNTGPSSVMTIHKNGGTGTLLNVKTNSTGGWVGLNQDQPTNPSVVFDVGGTVKIQGSSTSIRFKPLLSAPFQCDSSNTGALALTSLYVICTCNGTNWINGLDATACVWS